MRSTLQIVRWCASLGRKFTIVVPWATLAVVLSTLLSQFAILLATFLPLKVVILLGSDGVPRYFPSSFASIDRDWLVGLLSAAAASAFLAHIIVERLIKFSSRLGARRLLERSHKLILFENQGQIAANAYQRYAKTLASGVFVALVVLVLALVYREMAIVLVGYTAFAVLVFHVAASASSEIHRNLVDNLKVATSVAGNVGFLLGFGWLVVDFLFYSPPGLLPAIVSLLLSRLALARLAGSVADVAELHKQRPKLDALFFHGKALMPIADGDEGTIWSLVSPERRVQWVAEFLRELDAPECDLSTEEDVGWFQLRAPNCAGMMVDSISSSQVLIKLFDQVRQGMARHEAELLTSGVAGLPAPQWLGAGNIDDRFCHVMAVAAGAQRPNFRALKKYKQEVVRGLLAIEPPARLIERYKRSRPQLHQRVEPGWFTRMAVAADADGRNQLEYLRGMTEAVQQHLRALPPSIVNPDIVPEHLLLVEDGVLVVHWGDWKIEPLGCGWPVQPAALKQIDAALADAASRRRALKGVSPDAVRLAALMYAVERHLRLPRLTDALRLIPQVEHCIGALEVTEAASARKP